MESKTAEEYKKAKMRIPQQFCFWPVAESAYNSKNAQFCLVWRGKYQKYATASNKNVTYYYISIEKNIVLLLKRD